MEETAQRIEGECEQRNNEDLQAQEILKDLAWTDLQRRQSAQADRLYTGKVFKKQTIGVSWEPGTLTRWGYSDSPVEEDGEFFQKAKARFKFSPRELQIGAMDAIIHTIVDGESETKAKTHTNEPKCSKPTSENGVVKYG